MVKNEIEAKIIAVARKIIDPTDSTSAYFYAQDLTNLFEQLDALPKEETK